MRILFFSHYFPPEGYALASRTFAHCRRWVAAGHEVTVVTSAPNFPRGVLFHGYRNHLRHVEDWDGIRVVRVVTYLAANAGTWRRGVSYLSYMVSAVFFGLLERRPDVVIATSPQFFCGWAGVIVSRLKRRPFVLEIRDLWPESIVAVGAMEPNFVIKVLARLERLMYRAAQRVVTVGDGYRQRLLARGVRADRLAIVMNGVDLELFTPRRRDPELAAELGIANRFVVAYCGAVGLAHGLEVVLRSAALLRDRADDHSVVFLVVGDGARLDALKRMAAEERLDNVVFTGNVQKERVANFIALSDACLIHLRASEAFTAVMPSKVFETAAMARPIVLGVQGFAAEFVERARCGICVEPENERELVSAVLRLADDSALRDELGQAGRAHVLEHFDRDRLAMAYLGVIEQAVQRQ